MDNEIAEVVRTHGWQALSIADNDPPFLYTVGLTHTWGHPEMIVFGLEPRDAHGLIATLVKEIKSGRSFAEPEQYTIQLRDGGFTFATRRTHLTQHPLYIGYAMGFHRRAGTHGALEAVQVFWADNAGRFPFDANCDPNVARVQPQLNVPLTASELRQFRNQ